MLNINGEIISGDKAVAKVKSGALAPYAPKTSH